MYVKPCRSCIEYRVLAVYQPMSTNSRPLQPIDRWLVVTRPTDHHQLVDIGYYLSTDVAANTLGWIHRSRPTVRRHIGRFKSTISAATRPIVSTKYQSTGTLLDC